MELAALKRVPVFLPARGVGRFRFVLAIAGTSLASAIPAASQAPPEFERMVVLGANGEPAAEATVTVLRPPTQEVVALGATTSMSSVQGPPPMEAILLRTATTGEGVVRDALPQLRGLAVVVDHPMHLPFWGWYQREALPAVIRLQAGRTATGVVRESETGEPIEGAEVCAFWRDPSLLGSFGPEWRCVESGERGRFKLAGLPAADLDATAEARGFEADARTIEEGRPATRITFDLVARDEAAGEVEVGPVSAGLVRVELVGPSGEAMRNFTMRVHAVGRIGNASHDVEDAEGPVSVPINAAYANESAVDVSFQVDDYLRSRLIRVVPTPGGEVDLGLIALDRGAVVQGRLFDAAGAEPAVGCLVELLPAGAGAIGAMLGQERDVAVSDSEGWYLLGGLEAGRYHLRVQCAGVPVADRFLALGRNEAADQGESWLYPGRRVTVRVKGLGSGTVRLLDRFREIAAPVVEAALRSSKETAAWRRSDENASGQADFAAAPGVYRVEVVDSRGRLRVSQEVRIDEGPAEVQAVNLMLPTRTIRSVLFMGGRPVAGGRVYFGRVFNASRSSMKLVVSTSTGRGESRRLLGTGGSVSHRVGASVDLDGSFMVESAPVDLLWMTWSADDGSRIGRLWPADPLPQMDLSGVRVTGELRDADGAPVGGQVAVIADIGRAVAYAEVGDDGRFLLPPAPPGSYRIKADAGVSPTLVRQGRSTPKGSVSKEITLTTGEPPHQVLRVANDERGAAAVDIRRATGSPAAGAWVHFISAAGDALGGGLASAAGQIGRDVPAGEVTVVWNDAAACVGGVGLSVEAGRTTTLRQSLPMGRLVELRCRASECAGEPLSFLSVTTESGTEIASHLTGAGEGVRFSESGRLGLGCVTPGTYAVSFWAAGRRWGAEVSVSGRGPAAEPVIVNGREAGR